METYIVLLRGINVGGNNKLPMADLSKLLSNLELFNIRTYIQSGNIVFSSKQTDKNILSQQIRDAILSGFGFSPNVLILNEADWSKAVLGNPFPQAENEPKSLHFFFLEEEATEPDFVKLENLKSETESYQLIEQVFYLFAPDGIGRSKLAAGVEKALGVPVTARNWNTVKKLSEMLQEGNV